MKYQHYFLDANAHVPLSQKALEELIRFNSSADAHGNPSSPSAIGRKAANALEFAREKIASLIGAESAQNIIFTHGSTQACQWVLEMLNKHNLNTSYSTVEHPAVTQAIEKVKSLKYSPLQVDSNGFVALEDPSLHEDPRKFICIHLQNEVGTIQNIKTIKRLNPNHLVFSDISQSLGKIPVNVQDLNLDFAVAGAHKFGGTSGFGFIYIKNIDHWTQFGTGSRYFMDIPGTPNVSAAVAAAAALGEAIETLSERHENSLRFQVSLETSLEDLGFQVIGKSVLRSPNTTFVRIPVNSTIFLLELCKRGIHCGLGSACGSLYTDGSQAIRAMGYPSDLPEFIRFSQWGNYSNKDADYVINQIKEILKNMT